MTSFVCRVSDVPVGRMVAAEVEGRALVIARPKPDEFYAVRDACPHHGAPLSCGLLQGTVLRSPPGTYQYGMEGSVVRCPWHGFEFDLRTGEEMFIPGGYRLRTYPVAVEDGRLFVTLTRHPD